MQEEQWEQKTLNVDLREVRNGLNVIRLKDFHNARDKELLGEGEAREKEILQDIAASQKRMEALKIAAEAQVSLEGGPAAGIDIRTAGATLRRAAGEGDVEQVTLLCEHVNSVIDESSVPDRFTALHKAVMYGRNEVARILYTSGADVQLCDFLGRTPLMLAAAHGNTELVKALLGAGADVDKRDHKYSWNAFMFAVEKGAKECCEALYEAGDAAAALSTPGKDGRGALLVAQDKEHGTEFVKYLHGLHEKILRLGTSPPATEEAKTDSGNMSNGLLQRVRRVSAEAMGRMRRVSREVTGILSGIMAVGPVACDAVACDAVAEVAASASAPAAQVA